MPKRRDVPDTHPASHEVTKSRSGRVVKAKIYHDGTVTLLDDAFIVAMGEDQADHPKSAAVVVPQQHSAHLHYTTDEEEDEEAAAALSDDSEGRSFASHRRRRPSRAAPPHPPPPPPPPSTRLTASAPHAGYGGGGVFKQAAAQVLRMQRRLMSTGDITRCALHHALIQCTGKTPEATMASALYTDIKRKEGRSMFVRPREGLFGLREWAENGFPPAVVAVELERSNGDDVNDDGIVTAAAAAAVVPSSSSQEEAICGDDRLMELVCAAEAELLLNRATSHEEEDINVEQEEKDNEEQYSKEERYTKRTADITDDDPTATNEEDDSGYHTTTTTTTSRGDDDFERHASSPPSAALPLQKNFNVNATTAAVDVWRAAEAQISLLEQQWSGISSSSTTNAAATATEGDEMCLQYLELVKTTLAGCSMPQRVRKATETALERVEGVFLRHNHRPLKNGGAAAAAPTSSTPLAVDEARAAPFSLSKPSTTTTATVAAC